MQLSINNRHYEFEAALTLVEALAQAGYVETQSLAVAVNQCFVPKSEYTQTQLEDGDEVDVLEAISGG